MPASAKSLLLASRAPGPGASAEAGGVRRTEVATQVRQNLTTRSTCFLGRQIYLPEGPRMAESIDLAPEASRLSRLASWLLSYTPAVCALVAPRHPGASAAIFDPL